MVEYVAGFLAAMSFYVVGMLITFSCVAPRLVRKHGFRRDDAIDNAWEHARWWPLYMLVAPVWALRDFMESRVPESEKERKRRLRDLVFGTSTPSVSFDVGTTDDDMAKDRWLPGVVWPEPEPAQPPGSLIVDGKRETVDPPEQS